MSNIRAGHNRWSKEEDAILLKWYATEPIDAIVELLPGRTKEAIIIRASSKNLKQERNWHIKSNASLLCEETPVAYYWLGFLFADGHFNTKLNRLTIGISIKDESHLIKFANFVQSKYKILPPKTWTSKQNKTYTSNGTISVSLQDKYYVKKIIDKFKIKSNKTENVIDFDWNIEPDLIFAMIIGYIDGDGCIKNQSNRQDVVISFHVHKNWLSFLNNIVSFLNKKMECEIPYAIIGNDGYARLNITRCLVCRHLKKISTKLDLPVLNRKWEKIDENFITFYETANSRKKQILELFQQQKTIKEIAVTMQMSYAGIYKVIKKWKLL